MDIILPVIIVVIIGLIAGLGLSLASKFMAVKVDEREEKIRACLPGANCGACGYSGCDGYAAAINSGEATPDRCAPGGNNTATMLSSVLGVEIKTDERVAFIACGGNCQNSKIKFAYSGMQSCAAANLVHQGPLECQYGCMGYGDCMRACKFGAITIKDNRPVICEELCTACGNCVKVCPKSLISLIPKASKIHVACSNKQKGPSVVKACGVSCIACMQCEKNCPAGAIKIKDNVAVIDYSICTGCGKCKEVCKRKVIV